MATAIEKPTVNGTKVLRRNRPGTREQDMYSWPERPFSEIKSPFALQEYLKELVRVDYTDIDRILQLPEGQDPEVWQYEHLRAICQELNYLVVQLEPECTADSCPEMKAGEWIYLCAAHTQPHNCCAIDYTFHTLDGATSLLNSGRYFPSSAYIIPTSLKHFQSITRRLYRLMAHAWFAHREIFNSFENQTYIYRRFIKFTQNYGLLTETIIISPEDLERGREADDQEHGE